MHPPILYWEKFDLLPRTSQKSGFQPLTTKPDNIGHPTVETG